MGARVVLRCRGGFASGGFPARERERKSPPTLTRPKNSSKRRMISTGRARRSRTRPPSARGFGSAIYLSCSISATAGAVTHKDLLLESPVKLPLLSDVPLPLIAFFFLAPIVFIVSHAYTLVYFVMLAAKVGVYDAELRVQLGDAPEMRDAFRRQLTSNVCPISRRAGGHTRGPIGAPLESGRLGLCGDRPSSFVASDPGAIFALPPRMANLGASFGNTRRRRPIVAALACRAS
jgi:hypothetical protein